MSVSAARLEALEQLHALAKQQQQQLPAATMTELVDHVAPIAQMLAVAQSGRRASTLGAVPAEALDEDVLVNVFQMLSLAPLWRTGKVCREWHKAAKVVEVQRRFLRVQASLAHGGCEFEYDDEEEDSRKPPDSFEIENRCIYRARYNTHLVCCLPGGGVCVSVPSKGELRFFSAAGEFERALRLQHTWCFKGIVSDGGEHIFAVDSESCCVVKLTLG